MKNTLQIFILASHFMLVTQSGAADQDTRVKVDLPDMMKTHMLGNMRDHLQALYEIQAALAKGELDKAGEIAETRIGMSSLISYNALPHRAFHAQGDAGHWY